jgi:hypothetical protein
VPVKLQEPSSRLYEGLLCKEVDFGNVACRIFVQRTLP